MPVRCTHLLPQLHSRSFIFSANPVAVLLLPLALPPRHPLHPVVLQRLLLLPDTRQPMRHPHQQRQLATPPHPVAQE